MATVKPVWGIDLGQSALKAIRLRLTGDKVEATDHVYIEHKRILSQPDVDRQGMINDAMKQFIADRDLTREILVVGVPGQNTLARFTKLPPVKAAKIPEIVKYEAQQQIPFDMEEVIWDYQTFEDPVTKENQVGIFAMRRELLRSHLGFLSSLNLEPAIVQSSPLALYNALKYDGIVGTEPICILDIGAQNTDLIVVDADTLWTRNIPIGGNNFTDALLKTFKLSFGKAENLKRTAASSKYARQIFQAMRPVFADLVAEVQRSIGFFTSSRRGVKLTKVLAMGNAFKLPGMTKFVQQNLGMEVIRPTGFNKLVATEDPKAPELMDQLLSFAVAYGLAVQGLGKAAITSNLLPPEIAKQVVWRRKTPWFYGAAACLVASAAVVWVRNKFIDEPAVTAARGGAAIASFSLRFDEKDTKQENPLPDQQAVQIIQNGSNQEKQVDYAKEVAAAAQHLAEVQSKIESRNEQLIKKAEDLGNLQKDKLVWPRIITMIHNALPVDKEFNEALLKGSEAVKALLSAAPDKHKRELRKQIFIEKFESVFSPDVYSAFANRQRGGTTFGGPAAAAPTDAGAGGTAKAGFLIHLVARTPFKGKTRDEGGVFFVDREFVSALNQKGSAPGVYLDKLAAPTSFTPVKSFKNRSPGGGMMAPMATVVVPGQEERDPLTNEPIDDIEFEMTFVAVIGDKPADTPPQPGETPAGNPAGGT